MARIKKNDLVHLKEMPTYYDDKKLDWNLGIVLKGPYEDKILVSSMPNNSSVTFLSLVCDVMASGKVFKGLPGTHRATAAGWPRGLRSWAWPARVTLWGLDRPARDVLPARGLGGAFRWGGVWPLSALSGRSVSRRAERALG